MRESLDTLKHARLRESLLAARKKSGLSQTELAARLNRPQSYVAKYETGERKLEVLEFVDICEALEITPEQILRKLRD